MAAFGLVRGDAVRCNWFSYLIDEGCEETWWEVYERIGQVISAGNYDVALFGCGDWDCRSRNLPKKQAGRGFIWVATCSCYLEFMVNDTLTMNGTASTLMILG